MRRLRCAYCGESKPISAFPIRSYAACSECMAEFQAERERNERRLRAAIATILVALAVGLAGLVWVSL